MSKRNHEIDRDGDANIGTPINVGVAMIVDQSSTGQTVEGHHFEQQLQPFQNEPIWNGCGQPAAIHDCIIVKHRARQVVTAMQTVTNQLRLFSWRVNADGTVICTGTTEGQGVAIAQIDLVQLDPNHGSKYLTAWRTTPGELYLQAWDVSNTGAFYADGPTLLVGEQLTWFRLLALGPTRLLTIGLRDDGIWQLTTWQLMEDQAPVSLYTTTMPAADGALAASLCRITPPTTNDHQCHFTTVMHATPETLRWIDWQCLPTGQLLMQRQVDGHFPLIIELAMTTIGTQRLTFLHGAAGQLQLLSEPISPDGDPPAYRATMDQNTPFVTLATLANDVRDFSLTSDDQELLVAYTSSRAHPTQVTLLRCTPPDPHLSLPITITELGHLTVAAAHHLALCDRPLEGNAPLLTAIGTAGGGVHLTTWGRQ